MTFRYLTLVVPAKVYAWLTEEAKARGVNRSALVRRYIVAGIRAQYPSADLDWLVHLEEPPESWK